MATLGTARSPQTPGPALGGFWRLHQSLDAFSRPQGTGLATQVAAGRYLRVLETADGETFKSNVKGTLEETAQILKERRKIIGKSATVKYFNLTPAGIPRFPYVIKINREEYE